MAEENITNLLPRRPVIIKRKKRHVSKHHERAKEDLGMKQGHHATMGEAATLTPAPTAYLKKGHGHVLQQALRDTKIITAAAVQQRQCERRPALPTPTHYPPADRGK
ncbi:uncharacterized protein LOC121866142 [Homarus americanus]|uniref:uncharacterized protein LOC121866142 n=1 Tax=Homarus americanus TaxID=6706 RepID=UPI001C4542DB|nr:uncharacterized protein LOC121866142 [Homarus americanus]